VATHDNRRPVFAYDRAQETTLSAQLAAGANVATVASATGWAEGEHLFVSDADDSGAEYLGTVTDVTGTALTCQFDAYATHAIGAKVWTPTDAVAMGDGEGEPRVERQSGVVRRQTLSGLIVNARSADRATILTFNWPAILTASWSSLVDFLTDADVVNDGLRDFALAHWDYEAQAPAVRTVRLIDELPEFREGVINLASIADLRVQIVTDGEYPD